MNDVSELWELAAEMGQRAAVASEGIGELVRRVLALGRSVGIAEERESHAVARAIEAYLRVFDQRRERWLSFFGHELKSPLNILLNVLWLVRQRGPRERFLELAERAVHKLEQQIQDLRQLERKVHEAEAP